MSPSNLTSYVINGRQVNLLLAKFIGLGMCSTLAQLEWLEYGSGLGIQVMKLESLTKFQMARVVPKLEALEREGGIEA